MFMMFSIQQKFSHIPAIAKGVMHSVEKNFPYVSPTKVYALEKDAVIADSVLRAKLIAKQKLINEKRSARTSLFSDPIEYYKQLIEDVKSIRALNCAEYADIVYMLLRLNGVNKCRQVTILTGNKRQIDHTLVEINTNSKQNFLVDSWLNIAAYTERFKSIIDKKFTNCFELIPKEKISFEPVKHIILDDLQVAELRKIFPNFDKRA